MAGKFEIKRAKDGQFYFNLKARNGGIILTSEMYTTKANAQKGVASVMTNALLDQRFERKVSRRDDPYFALKAANGETNWRQRNVFLPLCDGKWCRVC